MSVTLRVYVTHPHNATLTARYETLRYTLRDSEWGVETVENIVEVDQLSKRYGSSRGVEALSFGVREGEVFGYLGPNGAGKTTTIRVLMGLIRPTSGKATIGGLDCWAQSPEVKRLVGYLPGEFSFDPALTGAQILTYLANLRGGVDRAYMLALVERLELDPSKKFREYSRGNKQKVGLAQAFMSRPRLLILDEPTAGLDPLNQQEFYRMVAETRAEGRTIFLSSHILPEVEHTCDRVGVIREGKLITVDRVTTLKDLKHHLVDIAFAAPASAAWFSGLPGVTEVITTDHEGRELRVTTQGELNAVIQAAAQHGAINFAAREPSLEEIFLRFYEPSRATAPVNS